MCLHSRFMEILHNPSDVPYWKIRNESSCYDLFFISTCDRLDDLNNTMKKLALKERYPISDMGIYIQPQVQGVSYHCEYNLFLIRKNEFMIKSVIELIHNSLSNLLACAGAFFSRPYGETADFAVWKRCPRLLLP